MLVLVLAVGFSTAAWAEGVPRRETPVYKVAFYAANCYHIQDENGRRSGYGYEMMQGLSKYMQCTFDYVGYDKTPAESVELLQSIGLKVDWAEDGQKAVGMFEKSAPGSYFAVFMDMQMPVMDGVEATRRIRASDRPDHDVPIFAMTANTFAADRKKCYDAGMSGYIPKPIDLETITHVLEEETGG